MCGISGVYNRDKSPVDVDLITKLNNLLEHRGPDNGSVQTFGHVALGHRRLSILDLSEIANQPMSSIDARYTIVFNGEVYNFPEIRKELEGLGTIFHTTSDTEVVLYAYKHYGHDCFAMFNGMFALAIYDCHQNELILARDQFGIKPLYYYLDKHTLVFGSEIKTILQHPSCNRDINDQAVSEYIWFGNPLGNNTIYESISELTPGSFMLINSTTAKLEQYFEVSLIKEKTISEQDAVKEIRRLLTDSVRRHLVSDVPVGVFLSGGIDSSAITAIASQHYEGKLRTYSVGFDFAKGPNELAVAANLAKKLDTDHQQIQISGENIISVIEELVGAHDEPFGDAADIPLYLLTQKLEGKIKVVLQGDGGDEFFGGYSRYHTLQSSNKWSMLSYLAPLIKLSGTTDSRLLRGQRFIKAISEKDPAVRNALLLTMESEYSSPERVFNSEYRKLLNNTDPFERYRKVYSQFSPKIDPVQALFYTDTQIILKDTYFEKVDKSTMANSIEVRVPFLDKNLTEFMLSLPANLKVKDGVQKYLLKKALEGTVPDEILYGKKTGFSVPYGYWLKSALSNYFIEQVSSHSASQYLDKSEIMKLFNLHKQDKGNVGFLLWKTLIFAVWINKKNN